MFFVNQKKHNKNTGAWDNNAHVKETLNAAMHQFHAFMSTYAYEQEASVDYASCSVEGVDGLVIKNEVDNRLPESEENP